MSENHHDPITFFVCLNLFKQNFKKIDRTTSGHDGQPVTTYDANDLVRIMHATFRPTARRFQLALRDTGACILVDHVILYYLHCPQIEVSWQLIRILLFTMVSRTYKLPSHVDALPINVWSATSRILGPKYIKNNKFISLRRTTSLWWNTKRRDHDINDQSHISIKMKKRVLVCTSLDLNPGREW